MRMGGYIESAEHICINCSLKGLSPLSLREEIISLLKRCAFREIDTNRFIPGSTFYGFVAHH